MPSKFLRNVDTVTPANFYMQKKHLAASAEVQNRVDCRIYTSNDLEVDNPLFFKSTNEARKRRPHVKMAVPNVQVNKDNNCVRPSRTIHVTGSRMSTFNMCVDRRRGRGLPPLRVSRLAAQRDFIGNMFNLKEFELVNGIVA